VVAGETGLGLHDEQKQQHVEMLRQWVRQQLLLLGEGQGAAEHWQPLGGDAGFRHYFRLDSTQLASGRKLLAVWAPPATEKNKEFVDIATRFRAQGITTPEVYGFDLQTGFILIEDLGDALLLDVLQESNVDHLYGSALDELLNIQQCSNDETLFAHYNRKELMRELNVFVEWFVPRLLGYELSAEDESMIVGVFEHLCDSALEQPQVIVHRDFHSRNLVYRENKAPGVIDFQDAVLGPVTYDVVSLLRDCYVCWPAEHVASWAQGYAEQLVAAKILPPEQLPTFGRWFDWMGLQRHIKVLGVFARLYLRDGKTAYLDDLPLVIHYTRSVSAQYPEFEPFIRWFDDKLLPLCRQQSWMR